jgi:hypothetical protein
MQTTPSYDIAKIRYATDTPTFHRAVELYSGGRVSNFVSLHDGFRANVQGTREYTVVVSAKHYDRGNCDCYLGRTDVLCKHMVAVAIKAVKNDEPLTQSDMKPVEAPNASEHLGELSPDDFAQTKEAITAAMRYITAYSGPSRTWFAYQNSLKEGYSRLSEIVSNLPVSMQTTKLLVDILLRLDHKLTSGSVDDSDGTVGRLIEYGAIVLKQFVDLDPTYKQALNRLTRLSTSFGWEVPLVALLNGK